MIYNNFSFENYSQGLKTALDLVSQNQVDDLFNVLDSYIGSDTNIFLLGNGGSQANAHHISGDYLKTFSLAGLSFKISSLSESISYLTAASNDVDFSEVYEILINTRIRKGDLLIFLSGSGNSINLIKPARMAKKVGIITAAVVGYMGGGLKEIVDIPIHIDIQDMEISEDAQMTIFHYLKQRLFNDLCVEKDIPNKYKKRTNEGLISW